MINFVEPDFERREKNEEFPTFKDRLCTLIRNHYKPDTFAVVTLEELEFGWNCEWELTSKTDRYILWLKVDNGSLRAKLFYTKL